MSAASEWLAANGGQPADMFVEFGESEAAGQDGAWSVFPVVSGKRSEA